MCEDFNINLLINDRNLMDSKHIFNVFHLKQIDKPTRVTSKSQTLIGNIFIYLITDYETQVMNPALSDHHGQLIEIPKNKKKQKANRNTRSKNILKQKNNRLYTRNTK